MSSALRSKITIIGAGTVGVTCAYALVLKGTAQEIILINRDSKKAEGEASDLQHAVPFGQPVKGTPGDYRDAADSAIVIFAAGIPGADKDDSRLRLLEKNAAVLRECMAKLKEEGFGGVLLIASNPVDVLTYIAQQESGLPHSQVIGSGTVIDTNRLRTLLGEGLGIEARSVHGYVIGEHGDSSVAVWSGAQVAGMPLSSFSGSEGFHHEMSFFGVFDVQDPRFWNSRATPVMRLLPVSSASARRSCEMNGPCSRSPQGFGVNTRSKMFV